MNSDQRAIAEGFGAGATFSILAIIAGIIFAAGFGVGWLVFG